MGRLCERPGCSEPGAASYGMVPEDLLFWVDAFHPADGQDTGVLCRRHSDAMVVPRGWTLDDRREPRPRLFRPPADSSGAMARPGRRRTGGPASVVRERAVQLELSAAGLDDGPPSGGVDLAAAVTEDDTDHHDDPTNPWMPAFDPDDDLDGLLHVDSPLLARAFRGTGRAR